MANIGFMNCGIVMHEINLTLESLSGGEREVQECTGERLKGEQVLMEGRENAKKR